MGLYSILIRPFVRRADIEKASRVALRYFEMIERIPGGRLISRWIHNNRPTGLQREVFGIDFYNPIGLGAGLDIYGELYNDLNNLGFSFVEIGPMNADGIRRAIRRIQQDPQNDILAACINEDYLTAFTLAYDFCDFFVIDLSTNPSTDILDPLLDARLAEEVYKPIVVKLPAVLPPSETEDLLDYCLMNGIDGIETPEQAAEALEAGASLIEVRDGLVRQGPNFVSNIQKYLLNQAKNERNNPKPDSPAAND